MFGLGKLWTAAANLVNAMNSLAGTVTEINHGLRAQLYLDGNGNDTHEAPQGIVLPHGTVAEPIAANMPDTGKHGAHSNGRRSKAAATATTATE
jgi:hypothetical protein